MSNSDQFIDLRSRFPALNQCMYCDSTDDLRKEHIIPYGLGGPSAVPRSSCSRCAEITSRFEGEVLRGPLWGLRAYLRLSSRRKHLMPTNLPFTIVRGGTEQTVVIPVAEHPIMLCFPIFVIPGCITAKVVEGITIKGAAAYNFGRPIKDVLAEYEATDYCVKDRSKPVAFARLLAKIAWGITTIRGRRADLSDELRDAILYEPNNIGRWVGTYTDPLEASAPNMLHEIRLREDHQSGLFMADVQLFANVRTPRYGIVLGHLTKHEA